MNFGIEFKNENKITLAVFILLAVSVFFFIHYFGVNILFHDEWEYASLVRDYQTNGFSFSELFKAHNEHRIFFPRLFYLFMLPVSHMSSVFYMYVNAILLFIELLILFAVSKIQFKNTIFKAPIWLVIIPLFVFNFRQYENILWAFQIAFYFVLIAVLASLYFIELYFKKEPRKHLFFSFAILLAIIATFSSGMGFFVWIAGFIQMGLIVAGNRNKKSRGALIIWSITGIFFTAIYYHGLALHNGMEGVSVGMLLIHAIKHLDKFLIFFFNLISLSYHYDYRQIAFPIGISLFIFSIFALYLTIKNTRIYENSYWIAIYIFSMLFSMLTTLGRFEKFFDSAGGSRYTTFIFLNIIASFVIFYDNYRISNIIWQKKFFKLSFIALIFFSIGLDGYGLIQGKRQKDRIEKTREVVLNYKTSDIRQFREIYDLNLPDNFLKKVNDEIPFLEENHYNAFHDLKKSEN